MSFKEIKPEELNFNPFTRIGSDWMLLTAGTEDKEFIDKEELFSVSFLKDGHRDALKLCGSVSGRDHDKIKEAGLTPVFIDGVPAFEEADTILICRKMYRTSMNPADFIDKDADSKFYPEKDYHDMYIAEIVKAVVAE